MEPSFDKDKRLLLQAQKIMTDLITENICGSAERIEEQINVLRIVAIHLLSNDLANLILKNEWGKDDITYYFSTILNTVHVDSVHIMKALKNGEGYAVSPQPEQ